ncbi:zinc finger protein 84-like isoform X2 [Armigeres subalbatus]|uniref:zinc finger protein 84-like isoform X2 n=1 Tax=Armigeres subalbatus TaxID=124917 RepID=UPI002ED54D9D
MKDSEDLELQVNAEEMCRTCLGQFPAGQLKPIFCNEILDGKIVPFPKALESVVGVKPAKNEIFPKNICTDCKSRTKELYSFKEKACKSFDLLYEIFGIEKPSLPIPSQAMKKEVNVTGTQTKEMVVQIGDLESYNRFLTIEKPSEPTKNDSACQVAPETGESICQTEPTESKPKRDVSTQVDPPLDPVEISENIEVEADVSIRADESFYVEETELDPDESYTSVDVIDDIEDVEEDVDNTELIVDDSNMPELLAQDEFDFDVNKANPKENDDENDATDAIQFLTYEVVQQDDHEMVTKTVKNLSKPESKEKFENECTYCNFVTNNKTAFSNHYAIHQQTIEYIFERVDYYRCMNCKSVYLTTIGLEKHFTDEPCAPIELDNLEESRDAIKHEQFYSHGISICLPRIKTFHMNESLQIVCSLCSSVFMSLSDALNHYSLAHDHEEPDTEDLAAFWDNCGYNMVHQCGICNEQFADASFIRQHIYFHKTKHDCPYNCLETYRDFLKLTHHLSRSHLKNACSLSTEARGILQPAFVCQICSKRFTSESTYKLHTKNHFADRRYTCTMCPKAFLQKCDLTIHIRSHTDERPFACTFADCDKKFRTSSHRRDHMSTHVEEKKYKCDICLKHFKAERILQGHMKLHSGFKPFECEECGKTFSRKHHVKLHMKTHGKN